MSSTNVQLRPPPRPEAPARTSPLALGVQLATLAAVVGGVLWIQLGGAPSAGATGDDAERAREVASKLKAAGATGEAAEMYAAYLASGTGTAASRAAIALSLGQLYMEDGQYERALRWLYEAESLDGEGLAEQVNEKVVHCLERLGNVHAAQAALAARTELSAQGGDPARPDTDPVVARIGEDEIRRSEIDRSLDDLPPQLRQLFAAPEQRAEYLRKYVADELLWRKAQKLEYEKDPEVRRQLQALLKQLVVSRFIEKEVAGKVQVDEADLRTYHQANRVRYDQRESARARVIEVADAATAERLRDQLGTVSFEKLAAQHSLHAATKAKGGALEGWVQRGDDFLGLSDPPAAVLVSDGLFATPAGQVSAPVIAGGHAYLFQVLERRPGKERPFEEVRAQVEGDYRRMKIEAAYRATIQEQLSTADVELMPEALAQGSR